MRGKQFGAGTWFLPDEATEPDGSVEIRRVLRFLYRQNTAAGDALLEARTGPTVAELSRAIPPAILDAMEREGLLGWIPAEGDADGFYSLTAEGRRASRRAAEPPVPARKPTR